LLHVTSALDRATDSLLDASRALVAVAVRSLAEVEQTVTLQQYRALVLLWERPERLTRDLAAELGVHASTATRLCDRLSAKRLLERRVSERDRREAELQLTDEGRRLVEQVLARRRAEIRRIARTMPDDLLVAAVAGLSAFSEAAARAAAADSPTGSAGWW
jgi:DNA-binding MarR family transcriptional regulator